MYLFKKIRKKAKDSFLYNILQNLFHKPLKSYSDCFGEDLFVRNYFANKKKGIYLDVGCNQPKKNSLTFHLHNIGWTGINIDISERCIKLYDYFRCKDINLNVSLGSKEKDVEAFIFYNNCTMNTVNAKFKNYTIDSVNKTPEVKKIKQITLNKVVSDYKIAKIDYLNIDVEGHEMEVLKGFNIKKIMPTLVSVEIHDSECPPIKNNIYKYFIKNKFTLVSIYGWTYFFESKKNKKVHFKF